MFVGINVCIFETQLGLRGLIYSMWLAQSFINFLGTLYMNYVHGIYFCNLKSVGKNSKNLTCGEKVK